MTLTSVLKREIAMSAAKLLVGILLTLDAGHFAFPQDVLIGTARVNLQFSPSNPHMADDQMEVFAYADLSSVITSSGGNPLLTGFSIPIGFDPSRVRLISASAGQAKGYSDTAFASTEVATSNARGFVTLLNMKSGTENTDMQVELARMRFQLLRPGKTTFLVGSARTIHPGSLIGAAGSSTATQLIPWEGNSYALQIGPGVSIPSLLCPSWFSGPNIFQGMGFLNEGTEKAEIQVFGWNRDGNLLQADTLTNPSPPMVLSSLQQEAKLTEEIFHSPSVINIEHGWLEVRSNHPDISGFFLQGITSPTGIEAMDGGELVHAPVSRLLFPMLGNDSSHATQISLVNPGDSPAIARISLVNADGSLSQTIQSSIPAHGAAVQEFSQTSGYLDIEADGGQLMGFERFGAEKALATLNGQDGSMLPNRLVGPQFASGPLGENLGIDTRISLVNPSSVTNQVTLRLLDDAGRELVAPVVKSMAAGSQLSDPGWKMFGLENPLTASNVTVGILAIESEHGIIGAMTFGDPVTGRYLTALPLMSSASAKRELFFGHVAIGLQGDVDYFTGLAIINASTTDTANVSLELYNKEGTLVAGTQTPVVLGPNSRVAQLVQQLIPTFQGSQAGGYVHLVSDVEVYGYMLFGDASYNFLSAVPVQ
jgi:hypothetical protein